MPNMVSVYKGGRKVTPKVLRVCGNCWFILFEHFVEHVKLIWILCVPKIVKSKSLRELEALTGRAKSNLSRTLKTLERYGIVELHKEKQAVIPEVIATDFRMEFGLSAA